LRGSLMVSVMACALAKLWACRDRELTSKALFYLCILKIWQKASVCCVQPRPGRAHVGFRFRSGGVTHRTQRTSPTPEVVLRDLMPGIIREACPPPRP
jgi:hypothetical protein